MIHCSALGLLYAVDSSWYNAAWTLGLVRPSARLRELLNRPILLISCALYFFEPHVYIKHISLFACVAYFTYNVKQTLGVSQYIHWYWFS